MAIVQYTAIVNQIRGKLNGSVFNKSRNAYTLGRKPSPPKGATQAQSGTRVAFGQVQRTWRVLTEAEKQSWATVAANHPVRDRFGQLVYMSGYNWFIKANMFNVSIGASIRRMAVPNALSQYVLSDLQVGDLELDQIDGVERIGLAFSLQIDQSSPTPVSALVSISPPVSNGVTKYYGNYYNLTDTQFLANLPVGTRLALSSRIPVRSGFPTYEPGDLVWVRILFFTIQNGVTYQEYNVRVLVVNA